MLETAEKMATSSTTALLTIFFVSFISKVKSDLNLMDGFTALTVEIENKEKLCFYEKFQESAEYVLEFQVMQGGKNDINVIVESPNGMILYKEQRRKHDRIPFQTSYGIYKFCFSNEFSPISHKTVHFEIKSEKVDSLRKEAGDLNPRVNTQLEESMESIHVHNSRVVHYQREYRVNEAKARYNADKLNRRVTWWSLGQAILVLVTGCGQVFMLKTFFTETRTTTKTLLDGATTAPSQPVPNQLLSSCVLEQVDNIASPL